MDSVLCLNPAAVTAPALPAEQSNPTAVAVVPVAAAQAALPLEAPQLEQALNLALRGRSTALEFVVDESTHTQVVVVRDAQSGDVVLQCPSEEALRMIRNLDAGLGGLVDQLV